MKTAKILKKRKGVLNKDKIKHCPNREMCLYENVVRCRVGRGSRYCDSDQ